MGGEGSSGQENPVAQLVRELQFRSGLVRLTIDRQRQNFKRNLSALTLLRRRPTARLTKETKTDAAHVQTATSILLHAEDLQKVGDLRRAIAMLEVARELEPTNAAVLSLLSKQWSDHSFLPDISKEDCIAVNDKAIHFAELAEAADPQFSLAHCAESICKGRKAMMETGPKKKLQLAKEAQEAAYTALALNQADDIAHHLIGRWNVGMSSLNFVVKACIKYVFGTDFRSGTMLDALMSYERAASLRPDRVIHRVELARCYEHFGRRAEAIEELKASLELPLEDINARQMVEEGAALLKQLDPTYDLSAWKTVWAKGSLNDVRASWPKFTSALEIETIADETTGLSAADANTP